jgi:hypothetical protein
MRTVTNDDWPAYATPLAAVRLRTESETMSMTLDRPVAPAAGSKIRRAILSATEVRRPYRHWWLRDVLPARLREEISALPFSLMWDPNTLGKRDTLNSRRIFVTERNREQFDACSVLASAFQDEATVALLEDLTGTNLSGGFVRIEYSQDTDGFWLEPHTGIGATMLTFLIYLSDHPDAENWGTDIMDEAGHVLRRVPGSANHGLMFVPDPDTWHGFAKRPIAGVRRSLIVNYVTPEWRARHELAFPDQAIVSGNGFDLDW